MVSLITFPVNFKTDNYHRIPKTLLSPVLVLMDLFPNTPIPSKLPKKKRQITKAPNRLSTFISKKLLPINYYSTVSEHDLKVRNLYKYSLKGKNVLI